MTTMPPEQPQGPQYGQPGPQTPPPGGASPYGAPGQQGQQYGQGQFGQPQHGQPPYGQPQYGGKPPYTAVSARPPAPPLGPGQKRGAFIAGAVALNLVNLGGSMLLAAVILGVVLAFLGAVLAAATRTGDELEIDPQARAFFEVLESINAPAWLIGGGILGLLILVLGIFTSFWILRAHGIARPWAVTWSAVGVSIPALVVVTSVLSVLSQVVGTLSVSSLFPEPGASIPDAAAVGFGTGIALVIVSFVVSLVVVALVGALIWWWMAHVLRRPIATPSPSSPAAPPG